MGPSVAQVEQEEPAFRVASKTQEAGPSTVITSTVKSKETPTSLKVVKC